ncbi:MAG: ATP-binding protein, partial [Paludibacter sp.]|nr:ATP-binding protein [Paludibacter sp.]
MTTINIPKELKKRDTYISRIKPFINKNLIKVLTGQRRVGKSYLLFQLMQEIEKLEHDANLIYINKEDLNFDFIRNAQDLNNYILSLTVDAQKNYIFIDEIQYIVEFEKALRSLLLNENNDIYITGSNANMLSGELATYLSGRYIEFNIMSLSYPEFLQFHQIENNDESLNKYFLYGGLPYLINLPLNNQVFEYLKSIYSTIVYRDVVSRYNIRNTALLERLIVFLADNIGNIFSAKRISDFLKSQQTNTSPNQIQQYTEQLANSFLLHKVSRYDIKGRRIFEIGEKYYFENTGIRNILIGYRPDDLGKVLENAVYNHLLYKGWEVKVGVFERYEIDFVCQRNGESMYIQVALRLNEQKTIEREFGSL